MSQKYGIIIILEICFWLMLWSSCGSSSFQGQKHINKRLKQSSSMCWIKISVMFFYDALETALEMTAGLRMTTLFRSRFLLLSVSGVSRRLMGERAPQKHLRYCNLKLEPHKLRHNYPCKSIKVHINYFEWKWLGPWGLQGGKQALKKV